MYFLDNEAESPVRERFRIFSISSNIIYEEEELNEEEMSGNVGFCESRKIPIGNDCKGAAIITAIFRSIEQADTLLELLAQRHAEHEDKQDEADAVRSSNCLWECKQAKDDAATVEEIKAVNNQLRNLITELVGQLESKDKKVLILKERLDQLEEEYTSLRQDSETEESSCSASFSNSLSKEDDEG